MTECFFKLLPDARSDKFFSESCNPWAGGVQPFVDAWPRGACSPSSLSKPADEDASRLQQNIQTHFSAGEGSLVLLLISRSHTCLFPPEVSVAIVTTTNHWRPWQVSEWEAVVYGKTEDQLIMTEQARQYLSPYPSSASTSRALVL